MTGPAVRRLGTGEWEVLRALRLAALQDAPGAFASTYEAERADPAERWRDRLARDAWFVAEVDGLPVGLVAARRAAEALPARRGLISLWVHPAHRGRGAAGRLVRAVVDWADADGAGEVALWVADGNAVAADLYRRLGFAPTGRRQPLPSDPLVGEREWALPLRTRP